MLNFYFHKRVQSNTFKNDIPLSELGKVVVSVVVVELVIAPVVLVHMYVAGSVVQCPSLVQVAVMVT